LSIQDISWVLKQDVRPPVAKLLLIALANYTNERHECWPSKATLAKDCSMSKASVCAYLSKLVELGLVTVEERWQDGAQITSKVRLMVPETVTPCPTVWTPPVQPSGQPLSNCLDTEPSLEPSMNLKNISDDDFERFWKAYPRRDGPNPKATALTAWKKAVKKERAGTILSATTAYAKECEAKGIVKTQFVPMASTWLNQERWTDVTTGGANGLTDERRKELERLLNA
jgi:hypothetical protein